MTKIDKIYGKVIQSNNAKRVRIISFYHTVIKSIDTVQLNEKQKQAVDCCRREEKGINEKSKRKCQLREISFWKPAIC